MGRRGRGGGKDHDGYIVRDVTRSRRRQSPVQESLQWRNRGGGQEKKGKWREKLKLRKGKCITVRLRLEAEFEISTLERRRKSAMG